MSPSDILNLHRSGDNTASRGRCLAIFKCIHTIARGTGTGVGVATAPWHTELASRCKHQKHQIGGDAGVRRAMWARGQRERKILQAVRQVGDRRSWGGQGRPALSGAPGCTMPIRLEARQMCAPARNTRPDGPQHLPRRTDGPAWADDRRSGCRHGRPRIAVSLHQRLPSPRPVHPCAGYLPSHPP